MLATLQFCIITNQGCEKSQIDNLKACFNCQSSFFLENWYEDLKITLVFMKLIVTVHDYRQLIWLSTDSKHILCEIFWQLLMYVLFYKQGPYEVGNIILGFDGVTQIMLALANSDNPLHQVQPQCQRSRPHDLSSSSCFPSFY